uniref:Uncharacterized protein n=1 Tax=viral metagenome TaxID=1070528 RepID=A0A6C0E473_9ZZZZ
MDLCKYKNALGEPGKGIHSYRLFGVAIADVIMTIIGAYLISSVFKTPFLYTLIILFLLGIFLHHLFCVRTTIDKMLFPSTSTF